MVRKRYMKNIEVDKKNLEVKVDGVKEKVKKKKQIQIKKIYLFR